MFKYLTKGLLSVIAVRLLDNFRSPSLQLLKIEAAKCYLRGVQVARASTIGLMWMGHVIGLIGLGALLFHAGLFILLPWTVEVKAVIAILLGSVYVAIGCFALHAAFDEKTWLEKSGVAKMLEETTGQSNKNLVDGKGSTQSRKENEDVSWNNLNRNSDTGTCGNNPNLAA